VQAGRRHRAGVGHLEAGLSAAATHAAHGTARARILSVLETALGTYRRSFWRIVVAAILVFAPIDLLVTVGATMAREFAESSDVLSLFLWSSGTALSVAGTTLSLVFFSGVLDRIVAADQKGEEELPLGVALGQIPVWRLIGASIAAAAFTVVGLLLFLIPGFVCMVLFAVAGPVIVIEDLGVWRGLRRSAVLTRSHAFLVIVTILIPTTLDEELSSWFEHFAWYEHPWVQLPLDVGSTIIVGGLVGVLEVTLAHALIAEHRRRREALAGAHDATPAQDATPEVTPAPDDAPGASADAGADQAAER
jgi:hypothetical protein